MSDINLKPFFRGTSNKVIAAFLLAFTGIALALSITYFSFHELMNTVDELSEPNKKLRTLNELFRRITSLDQQQRTEIIKSHKSPSAKLLNSSNDLFLILDTLKTMNWQDTEQLERVYAMQEILRERDKFFANYLHVKYETGKNKTFLLQLDSLSNLLSQHTVPFDTTIITRQKQETITSYIPVYPVPQKDDRSFFKKLFKKKKDDDPEQSMIRVQEEISMISDTIPLTKKDSAVYHVSQVIKSLNTDQRSRNREMIQRELKFISVNTALINELLTILHEVETEEVKLMRANNSEAAQLVNVSIKRIIIFLILFFLTAALLLFFILIDISKSNYYRNQLVKAKEEAEQLSLIKQRFLSNMSHEIRTPLQSIIGYSEQLKGNETTSSHALDAIQSSADHLLHIVNEVLDYSRIESGKLSLQNQPFNITDCMDEVFAAIKIQADKKGLSLYKESDVTENLIVSGDAFRLRQIAYNILSNAVKFTHTGFVNLAVDIKDYDHAIRCTIKVIDSGIGMNPEALQRIFNQFEQANPAAHNTHGGTGLGLTIVKSLVDAQHGTIDVASKEGEGSTFTITLMFGKPVFLEPESSHTNHREDKSEKVKKVLVVDDDPLILRLCSIILHNRQIPHELIQYPHETINGKLSNAISHVLLDIRMPGISGIDICQTIRKEHGKTHTIIALTAHALPNEQAELLTFGFDQVLLKPFREHDLLASIGFIKKEDNISTPDDIDFTLLNKMTFDDKALQASVIHQFLEETVSDITNLDKSIEAKDVQQIHEIIHKLTGRIGQIGGFALSGKLREAEKELTTLSYNDSLHQKLLILAVDIKKFQAIISKKMLQLS